MAKLKDLKVTIGLSKRGLTKLNSDLRRTKSNFRRNFGEIAGMAKNAAAVIGTTLVAGIGVLIKKGAEMETLRTGFISLAGGANKAAAIVKELNEFTAKTPFQLQEVSNSARQLLAVGTQRSELQKELKMLGDIAASSGNSISDISAILAKVRAKGKVDLEALNQLAERRIPIFNELKRLTGDAQMEFGAGAVSVDQFTQALANMTAEGGLAAGAMENLSNTVEGRMTTLMDNLGLELGKAAEKSGVSAAFSGMLKDATESLQGISGVAQSDVAAALGLAEEAMEGFGNVSQENLSEVESKSAEAQAAIKLLHDQIKSSAGQTVGLAGLFGGTSGALEAAKQQAGMLEPLLAMMDELGKASLDLNTSVQAGTLAQTSATTATTNATTANEKQKKQKEELIEMERSHLLELGKVKELHGTMASDIMAAAEANHVLQGSYQEVSAAATTTLDGMVVLGNFAGSQLPGLMESAFTSIVAGAGQFKNFMLDMLEKLLVKLAAMLAAFAAMSILFPGSGLVQGGLGKFMGGQFGIAGFAAGGMVTGPTMAMVGEGPGTTLSNPEVIAPLDKLQQMMGGGAVTVTGMIRGSDILLSNERSALDRNRVRGF
jgi:hypothetical protein